MTTKVLVNHSDVNQELLEQVVHLAEQVRNMTESIYNYMDSEAELDMDVVDTFRVDAGDIGDLVFELKYKLDAIVSPHRKALSDAWMADWMEREKNDPDMDGRC